MLLLALNDTLSWAIALPLIFILVAGLIIWLLGSRLLKFGVTMGGITIGAILGSLLCQLLMDGEYAVIFIPAGAIVGFALSFWVFRLWVGISLALMLGLFAPMAHMAYQGIEAPVPVSDKQLVQDDKADSFFELAASARDTLNQWMKASRDRTQQWWKKLDDTSRNSVLSVAGIALLAGLGIGSLMPNNAARVESAVVGSLLILLAADQLLSTFIPDSVFYLPRSSRAYLITLGVLTLIGLFLQWTVFKRKADSNGRKDN